MDAPDTPLAFSLLGGPLYQLGRRLGVVRGDTNTVRLGLVLGGGLWIILLAMAVVEGITDRMFAPSFIGGNARLLVVIPLFLRVRVLGGAANGGVCTRNRRVPSRAGERSASLERRRGTAQTAD
jgi:hypothetical protein